MVGQQREQQWGAPPSSDRLPLRDKSPRYLTQRYWDALHWSAGLTVTSKMWQALIILPPGKSIFTEAFHYLLWKVCANTLYSQCCRGSGAVKFIPWRKRPCSLLIIIRDLYIFICPSHVIFHSDTFLALTPWGWLKQKIPRNSLSSVLYYTSKNNINK